MTQPVRPTEGSFFAITTSDTVNFPNVVRAIYVGGAGNVTAVNEEDVAVLFTAPPVGSQLKIRAKRVNATGTTATVLVGIY